MLSKYQSFQQEKAEINQAQHKILARRDMFSYIYKWPHRKKIYRIKSEKKINLYIIWNKSAPLSEFRN